MTKAVTVPLVGRKLARVKLENMQLGYTPPDGVRYLSFSCEIQLEGPEGKRDGPSAMLWVGIPADDNMSIQEFESGALARSAEMIQRLSTLGVAELEQSLKETKARNQAFWAGKPDSDA